MIFHLLFFAKPDHRWFSLVVSREKVRETLGEPGILCGVSYEIAYIGMTWPLSLLSMPHEMITTKPQVHLV